MVLFKVSMDLNKKLDKYHKPTQLKFVKILLIEVLTEEQISFVMKELGINL